MVRVAYFVRGSLAVAVITRSGKKRRPPERDGLECGCYLTSSARDFSTRGLMTL